MSSPTEVPVIPPVYHVVLVLPDHFSQKALELLQNHPRCSVHILDNTTDPSKNVIVNHIQGAHALVCRVFDPITEAVVDKAGPTLKVISTVCVGTDHIDKEALRKRGIRLGNTADITTDACADLITCLTISVIRRTVEGALTVRNGEWLPLQGMMWLAGRSPRSLTFGILGLGKIGQAVAGRLKGFKPKNILYCNPKQQPDGVEKELGATWQGDLVKFLQQSDVVIVTCSLNAQTRQLLSKEKLQLMKRGSFLINGSRGQIIDQDGLIELLKEGHFGGVGLDVTTPEPLPSDHPLLKFREVTVLPHIASAEVEAREEMAFLTIRNIIAALEDSPMPSEVFY